MPKPSRQVTDLEPLSPVGVGLPRRGSVAADERPRARMARCGAGALSDAELVALLIEPGSGGRSSLDIARELVAAGLLSLARREWIPGKREGPLGPRRVARVGAALELGRRVFALSAPASVPIHDPLMLANRLVARFGHRVQETFGGVFLDSRNRVVSEREIFIGSLMTATAIPRDVFRFALQDHAAAVVVFHNHPSGDSSPSPDDISFTRSLIDAGDVIGVEVRDHLVVTPHGALSMKSAGFI